MVKIARLKNRRRGLGNGSGIGGMQSLNAKRQAMGSRNNFSNRSRIRAVAVPPFSYKVLDNIIISKTFDSLTTLFDFTTVTRDAV